MSPDPNFDALPGTGDDISWARVAPPPVPAPSAKVPPPRPTPSADLSVAMPTALGLPGVSKPVAGGFFRDANRWIGSVIQRFTLPEDAVAADPLGKLVTSTPPWFISLIVHFSMMIVLGLAVIGVRTVAHHEEAPLEMDLGPERKDNEVYAETLGQQLEDPSIKMSSASPEPSKDTMAAIPTADLPKVADPLIGPPVLSPGEHGTLASGTVAAPNIGLEFSGREEGVKDALLKAYGGTALTEDAVKDGLAWLARQQKPRGSWSLKGPYSDGARGENEEAATAMALLAFQGAGYTPKSTGNNPFVKNVTRGWAWLLKSQAEDGHFYGNLIGDTHKLYTHAMCTIALCELYGMTRSEELRAPAQKAVDYCVKIQAAEGGWRYTPGTDSDLSVTGWYSMALQSARMAGLEVPSPTYANISKFLDSVSREEGSRYAYHVGDGATPPITAEGLLCRQYLGWSHDDPRLRKGLDFLLTDSNLPAWDKRNVYYWYYATQVCHHMEGSDWVKWNSIMRQLLPEHQEKKGSERGSWSPAGDRWGDAGGRLYVTCLSLYTLEVYYRHLPVYRHEMLGKQ